MCTNWSTVTIPSVNIFSNQDTDGSERKAEVHLSLCGYFEM